jgi:hypothetical protein
MADAAALEHPVAGVAGRWQAFVLAHGYRARAYHLAAITGAREAEIERLRSTGAISPRPEAHDFPALFALWHGRAPSDAEWPAPQITGGNYEWFQPELVLLASLVGQMGPAEISGVLTARLREITGDATAERSRHAVAARMQQVGLTTYDVLGGITIADAAREIGSKASIDQAIAAGRLAARRVGRLWVIPHKAWADWKAAHTTPPEGYVRLSVLKEPLALRSDKLSEWARMGYVTTAVQCNPAGAGPSTQFGTWWIDKKVADQLIADRHEGKPMPWHGKPMLDNLRATFRMWEQRKHPAHCETCAQIWGADGPPADFNAYIRRYPALLHGAKRHLTLPFNPGLTVREVVEETGRNESDVRRAIETGSLAATKGERGTYVSRTDVTRWKARRCPTGDNERSWISLDTACKQYLFTLPELRAHITAGRLASKIGDNGPMRGIEYVGRHQCAQLRESIGFTEAQAAARVGVSVEAFRQLLEGANWRGAEGIPLATVQAVIKRLKSCEGYSIEDAARRLELLGATVPWVKARIADGTVKVSRAPWDMRRVYLTTEMVNRLRQELLDALSGVKKPRRQADDGWLTLSEAALEAGVSQSTLRRWADDGDLARQSFNSGWKYPRDAVRASARGYWPTCRLTRAVMPAWLAAEQRVS